MPRRFNDRPKKEVPTNLDWLLDQGTRLWSVPVHADPTIAAAVEALPEPYRSVLEMRYWGRLTHREVAEEMGWSDRRSAAKAATRARRRLAEILKSNGSAESTDEAP